MTNREFLSKSITDLSNAEKTDAVVLAKNILDYVVKNMPENDRDGILDRCISSSDMIMEIKKINNKAGE